MRFFISGLPGILCNCGSDSLELNLNHTTSIATPRSTGMQSSHTLAVFDKDFMFGIASAPAQAEDGLNDDWKRHAEPPYNFVSAYKNIERAEKRLNFWSRPDVEIDLAKNLGADIYRYGIAWQRLAPEDPSTFCQKINPSSTCLGGIQDEAAWEHYRDEIFNRVDATGMKTMLTLFHHSAPLWFVDSKGWLNPNNAKKFVNFSKDIINRIQRDGINIDYWITLNEPNIYTLHSYIAGIWPGRTPGSSAFVIPNLLDYVKLGPLKGKYYQAIDNMIVAHKEVYDYIHQIFPHAKVSFAHNMSKFATSGRKNLFSKITEAIVAREAQFIHNQYLLDSLSSHLDFIGINYYGREILSLSGPYTDPESEYMDSGRNIDPEGFFETIMWTHKRYNKNNDQILPIFITENGISDSTDTLRSAYLIEHLLALKAAQNEGVPILGYIYWTLSDNFEWSDGYCPKFGLLAVDRSDPELETRIIRPFSYKIFKDIFAHRRITNIQRNQSWQKVMRAKGQPQPMCRDLDGVTAFDEPNNDIRQYTGFNWQFHL